VRGIKTFHSFYSASRADIFISLHALHYKLGEKGFSSTDVIAVTIISGNSGSTAWEKYI
jgi:hypothetical protein